MNKLNLATITGVLAIIGSIATGVWHLDTRYAMAGEFQKLEQRVLMNELNQSYRDIWAEVLYLRKQLRKYPDDQDIKDQLEKAEQELKRLKDLLKKKESRAA
jgi:hypothetical protein